MPAAASSKPVSCAKSRSGPISTSTVPAYVPSPDPAGGSIARGSSASILRRVRATSASSAIRAPRSSRRLVSSVTRSAICTASSSAFIRIRVACRRACP